MKWRETFWRGFWWKLGAALAIALLTYVVPSKARAQQPDTSQCNANVTSGYCQTAAEAYQAVNNYLTNNPITDTGWKKCGPVKLQGSDAYKGSWIPPYATCGVGGTGQNAQRVATRAFFTTDCPAGQHWDADLNRCRSDCLNEKASNKIVRGDNRLCQNGCVLKPQINGNPNPGDNAKVFNGCYGDGSTASARTCWAATWSWGGEFCGSPTQPEKITDLKPDKPVCQKKSGASYGECVYPDGKHCVTGPSSGQQLCWKPGETGTKSTPDGDFAAKKVEAPALPGQPDGVEGGTSETTTTTVNNTTYNSSVVSGGVSNGAQGDTGTDGDGDSGSGGSQPQCNPQEQDCNNNGEPTSAVGKLYEGNGKTVGDEYAEFRSRVSGSPLLSAGQEFFNVGSIGASCPVFTVPSTYYWEAMTFEYHCTGVLAQALASAGYLLLAIAAYTAFKIGFG